MAKGNSKAYLNSVMTNTAELDNNENVLFTSHCLDIFNSSEPDLHNESEVREAINNYFNTCIDKGLRPGNLGLYAALGMNYTEVSDLLNGRNPKKASIESIRFIKKACKALSAYREMLGSHNKILAPTLIFWEKNYDGLQDIQRVDVAPVNNLQAEKTPEELQRIAEQDIPVDAE